MGLADFWGIADLHRRKGRKYQKAKNLKLCLMGRMGGKKVHPGVNVSRTSPKLVLT